MESMRGAVAFLLARREDQAAVRHLTSENGRRTDRVCIGYVLKKKKNKLLQITNTTQASVGGVYANLDIAVLNDG
jgi:hypothetical protein